MALYGAGKDEDSPDHSKFLWHLTKSRVPLSKETGYCSSPFGDTLRDSHQLGNAQSRLISILTQEDGPRIWSSHLHYMTQQFQDAPSPKCVCFTECIPHALLKHSERYSRWGFLFSKERAYLKGVRPVWYVDIEYMNRFVSCKSRKQRGYKEPIDFPTELTHLLMPFVPEYDSHSMELLNNHKLDWTVELEWRTAGDFEFVFDDLTALIVPTKRDMESLKQSIPELEDVDFVVSTDLAAALFEHKDFNEFFWRNLH